MKKAFAIVLILAITLCFAACGESADTGSTTTTEPVTTTTTETKPTRDPSWDEDVKLAGEKWVVDGLLEITFTEAKRSFFGEGDNRVDTVHYYYTAKAYIENGTDVTLWAFNKPEEESDGFFSMLYVEEEEKSDFTSIPLLSTEEYAFITVTTFTGSDSATFAVPIVE